MSFSRLNLPGVFGPAELTALYSAFDVALRRVSEGGDAVSALGARDLRRRLAAGIISAAQDGVTDAEDLAAERLRALESASAAVSDPTPLRAFPVQA